jgi:hypothetical protein
LAACGKTMTEADCERVGRHMRSVWDAEAAAVAPKDGAASERARLVIKSEGDKIEKEWSADCRRELEGRKVDDREVECILAAGSIAAMQLCAHERR